MEEGMSEKFYKIELKQPCVVKAVDAESALKEGHQLIIYYVTNRPEKLNVSEKSEDEDLLKNIASTLYEEDNVHISLRGTVEKVEGGYWVEARVWVDARELVRSERQTLQDT